MKRIKISLAGVSFRNITGLKFNKDTDLFIIPEPDNKFDPNAVGVYYKELSLGYIPKNAKLGNISLQQYLKDMEITSAKLIDYKYKDGEDWNRDHRGKLHFVEIEIEVNVVEDTPKEEIVNPRASQTPSKPSHRDYSRFGKDVISITELLKYLNPEGDTKYMDMWMINNHATYEEFEAHLNELSEAGTLMHNRIEEMIRTSQHLKYENEAWHKNWLAFMTETGYGAPRDSDQEKQVFDEDLEIAGTYDYRVEEAMIDWKSSKSVYLKHKLQIAFYAKNTGCKRALVVPLGYTGRIMTPVNKNALNEYEIGRYYQVVVDLKKAYDLLKGE